MIFGILVVFFTLFAAAEDPDQSTETPPEEMEIQEELDGFMGAIPPEVAACLPAEFFGENMAEMAVGVQEAGSVQAVLAQVWRILGASLRQQLALLARICGILVLSAVVRLLSLQLQSGEGVSRAAGFYSTLAMVSVLFSTQRSRFLSLSSYFTATQQLCAASVPLMGALYAMGGNVGAAVAHHGVMTAFLAMLETVISGTVMPVAGICLALALADALSGKSTLRSLAGLIKRTYTLTFSFLMLLLCGILGIQTTLAKGSDTLALRTVRFAAGSFLPVVGGSISEALRTVSGSVTYLRAVVGSGVIVVFLLSFLPVFLPLLLGRITFQLGGAAAKLLGCDHEEKLLSELAAVYGYFMAVVASLFVMIVFSLTLFTRCATAGGGG